MHASPTTPHGSQQAHTIRPGRGPPLLALHALTFILCNNNHENPCTHACIFSEARQECLTAPVLGAAGDTRLGSGRDACHGSGTSNDAVWNADFGSKEVARGFTGDVGTGSHR